ncbi:MAG: thioredoxin family protein [Methanoregulaceae archaeon]|nr:thioredoxin family protein [Methanoregulaceae archaeon]
MKIEVLGIGCPNCRKLSGNVQKAVEDLGIRAEIVKVDDMADIMGKGVMILPALFVNGEAKVVGRVAPVDEIKRVLKEAGS